VIILLEARPEVIARRVSRVDDRPLLSESQQGPLLGRIEALMRQRAPFYEDHNFRVDTSEMSPEQVMAEILAYLEQMPDVSDRNSE
jgi:shikimate kinase